MRSCFKCFAFLWVIVLSHPSFSQTVVKGKVTDVNSGDPIPFANVIFKGTTTGTTTDFDGNFSIKSANPVDSVVVSYLGYKTKTRKIQQGLEQVVNFQLEEITTSLQEVVFDAGENPAYSILRNVVRNKNKNDKRKLTAYEYDTYTKIEIDVDNITEKFKKRKVMQKITQVMDSVDRIAGEDGKPILPLFISESVSKYYYRKDPELKTENILRSKINGVGVEDGTLVTQLVGTSFQEYNFYQNWLNVISKEFVSPIADGWRLYYNYDLTDSVYIGDDFCYRLDFFPRSPQDLAFSGTIWITKGEYALKQIDASVGKQANLNFIEKIRIQQELVKTEEGSWLPVKNRVLIDISELTKFSAGMLAKFYTSNKNIKVNKPYDASFYSRPIVMAEDARQYEQEEYWDTLRHEPLSETEKSVYKMIDTLQNIPIVKTYTDIIKIVVNGYYNAGKINIGPYISALAYNDIEGVRVEGGFKTNMEFSKRWVVGGSLGYGFNDGRLKYSAFLQHILSRDRWTTATIRLRSDLGRVGIDEESLADNYLFLAAQRFGIFRRGYYFNESKFDFRREIFKGFTQRIAFKHSTFKPTFNFGYYQQGDNENSPILNTYENAEVIIESRFARDEIFLQNDNERLSLGTLKWPIVTIRYTHGLKGFMGSDFEYDKLRLSLFKKIRFGPLGVGAMNLAGEYVFNTLPYPLLSLHLGNQTPIYAQVTYNLMDYGEFISDRYASMQYQHHFEGFLLNRIPLMKKLKWRLVGTANVIYGGMNWRNRDLIAETTSNGEETPEAGFLARGKPYVELGYGVENIFKFFRVDFIHRLSYLDKPDTRKFGVFFSFQFNL
ncbi:DUF5686 and carboxypeptidase-like regulatory domain-containing protein [Chryseosolibacter indicus]|uniref:DUF5686 and carboxypeptidase-like regulatory domain-containing protein n=1 Tax=Chryseosolibacter indicus TaxID=2782351 RepID=UPI0020B1E8A2|nr:DUF5686 and carboxypeptidase-like regulatory domain-containing protein [Chryseosolibacter indicus]